MNGLRRARTLRAKSVRWKSFGIAASRSGSDTRVRSFFTPARIRLSSTSKTSALGLSIKRRFAAPR